MLAKNLEAKITVAKYGVGKILEEKWQLENSHLKSQGYYGNSRGYLSFHQTRGGKSSRDLV